MKKSTLIGISILSIFILCSLSYQPIIADRQIEYKPIIVDDTKTTDEDCGCNVNYVPWFPFKFLICSLIFLPSSIIFIIWTYVMAFSDGLLEDVLLLMWTTLQDLYYALGCPTA